MDTPPDLTALITAINAYAEAQRTHGRTAWLALVHRSNTRPAAVAARTLREAARDAMDQIEDAQVPVTLTEVSWEGAYLVTAALRATA